VPSIPATLLAVLGRERSTTAAGGRPCFLCKPTTDLIYAVSQNFFATLGLGPLCEGYSLIATRVHTPSMFDVSASEADELAAFTREVRLRLEPHYGPSLITEHGRVPPCLDQLLRTYEPHCLHAHRLVFPGVPDLDLATSVPQLRVEDFSSFLNAKFAFRDQGQYLYAEGHDGSCQLAAVGGAVPRQFFRTIVASRMGTPERADWQAHPGHNLVAQARERLRAAA
jgi:hypothetical protein